MRNILGTKNLHEILSDRESISADMQVIFPKRKNTQKEKKHKKHKKQKPQTQEEKTQQQNRESVSADMQVKKRKKNTKRGETNHDDHCNLDNNHPKSNCI